MNKQEIIERIQKMAVKLLATSPAGEGLCLIGGFRYRLLDQSCRRSVDLDYHWAGDLIQKQEQIIALFKSKLLPLIKSDVNYAGDVQAAGGPDADSETTKTINLVVYQNATSQSRVEIPIDITNIVCLDRPIVRTVAGTVYLSASDADMVESKVLALINRIYPAQRDIVDIFLFQDKLAVNSAERLREKMKKMELGEVTVRHSLEQMCANRQRHIRTIDEIIKEQMDRPAAEHITQAGGGLMVFDRVMTLLTKILGLS